MLHCILNSIGAVGYWIGDQLTDLTGLAALRIPLERARSPREFTLDLPGYMQTNSYACGAITAAMIVHYFRRRMSFSKVYNAVNPSPEIGAGEARVVRGLRSCGLHVSIRKDLRFRDLRRAIDGGRPVMVHIINPGADCGHWIAVYGYARRPRRVFLATNGLPWLDSNRIAWGEFQRLWKPRGNGLICRKAKRSRT
jgi:hypothetical protein